jgi:hypothetical protein
VGIAFVLVALYQIINLVFVGLLSFGLKNALMILKLQTGYQPIRRNAQNVILQLKKMVVAII